MSKKLDTDESRRRFLKTAGTAALVAGIGLPLRGLAVSAQARHDGAQAGSFRFVFMPDFHLRREFNSAEGMAKALQALKTLNPPPTFIVTGGDLIHEMRSQSPAQCEEMVTLFSRIWADNTRLPTYHALGNHDVAGLTSKDFPRDHPLFGCRFLKDKFGLPDFNYSFDREGWHFIVLHNVCVTPDDRIIGEFSAETLRFLRDDLAQNGGRPTLLFGHYPPVSAIEFFAGEAKKKDQAWELGYSRACRNPIDLVAAIGNANVKAFFSGHIHLLDRIETKGQTFICAGSVSGDQWRGPDVDTPEGFAVVDCHTNGTFQTAYHAYGWKAHRG